ncbi:MAG: helix-turn-helix transcriptional regulator [Clostridia bacterium]|nr:helix-turn-helix transcriptional regulator [Clostridia bacterium]
MKLYIGDTIRRLRLAKDMTQEQLAYALGVSFQSVSRWENGTNYPDIELIPEIAIYFGISTDDLMGLSGAIKEEKLSEAWRNYYAAADNTERLSLLREMRRDFPENTEVLLCLANIVSEFPELYAEQKALTEEFIASSDPNMDFTLKRNNENLLILALFETAPDKELEDLIDKYSSENVDMTRTALLNRRYFVRKEWDKYESTRQIRLRELLQDLFEEKLRKQYHASAAYSAWAQRKSLEIMNVLADHYGGPLVDPVPDMWFKKKYFIGFRLSCALASDNKKEEALSVLEDTITLIENFSALPVGSKLTYNCPSLDNFSYTVIPFSDSEDQPHTRPGIPLKHVEYRRGDVLMCDLVVTVQVHPLFERDGWEWFDPIREEPRFLACLERIKKLQA